MSTALSVQTNGGFPATADQLNTYIGSCDNVSVLRGFIGVTGMQVFIRGTTNINDGGQGNFYWNSTGTAADDGGINTVVPTGATQGEWTRISNSSLTNLSLAGTLTVAGATVLNSTLSVAGNTTFAGTVSGGFRVYNNQTGASYTIQASDDGLMVTFSNASAVTVTVPNNLPVGFNCGCMNINTGKVTFTAASGATLNNRSTQYAIAGQYGEVGLDVISNSGGTSAVYILAGDTSA